VAFARREFDLTAVIAGDVAHDGQPETCASGVTAAPAVDAVEALEDALVVAGRDANAAVFDVDGHSTVVG
jgi:hypothetical protein